MTNGCLIEDRHGPGSLWRTIEYSIASKHGFLGCLLKDLLTEQQMTCSI